MEQALTPREISPAKSICIGLTCWRWEKKRPEAIVRLAERLGVTLRLKEKIRGLHLDIEAEVSGRNIDRFIGEFGRHC